MENRYLIIPGVLLLLCILGISLHECYSVCCAAGLHAPLPLVYTVILAVGYASLIILEISIPHNKQVKRHLLVTRSTVILLILIPQLVLINSLQGLSISGMSIGDSNITIPLALMVFVEILLHVNLINIKKIVRRKKRNP